MGKYIDKANVKVTLTRASDSKKWVFSNSKSNGFFNVDNSYFGQVGCIIFKPNNLTISGGDSFTVSITGISPVVSYNVNFFYLDLNIKNASVNTIKDRAYTGKAIKPTPTVKFNGKKLKKGTDYSVKYSKNKKIGKAKITITGKGKYKGSKTIYFKINPKASKISGLTKAKKAFTIKWKKVSGVSGYQVSYKIKGKAWKTKSFTGAKKTSAKISRLKSKKNYQVRIRSYKKVSGKKYYSSWSKVKKIKVK